MEEPGLGSVKWLHFSLSMVRPFEFLELPSAFLLEEHSTQNKIVRRLTTKKGPNLALHPIDLKLYILVLDTPTTNSEPGYSRLLPSHHPCGGK